MILIDAREGVSGDMLLAAMVGLLDQPGRKDATARLMRAAERQGLTLGLLSIEEAGDQGLAISYTQPEVLRHGVSHDESFALLGRIEADLGSAGDVGRRILEAVFDAEGEAHGLPPEEVHLHEIGRPQAMVNIAGIGMLSHELLSRGAEGFTCSTITTGKGIVVVSHGAVRVPAPATNILLRGLKHETGADPGERATPTGIAALKVLAGSQTESTLDTFRKKSIGFGTRRFGGRLGRTTLVWR